MICVDFLILNNLYEICYLLVLGFEYLFEISCIILEFLMKILKIGGKYLVRVSFLFIIIDC